MTPAYQSIPVRTRLRPHKKREPAFAGSLSLSRMGQLLTNTSRTQGGRSEFVIRGGAAELRCGGFLVVHAQSDVAACQQVVQGLGGMTGQLLGVDLDQVAFTYAPQGATAIVVIVQHDGPGVLIHEEVTLCVDVTLACLDVALYFPHAVQLEAGVLRVDVTGLQDIAVLQFRIGQLAGVVRNVDFLLADQFPVVTVRCTTEHVEVVSSTHAVGRSTRTVVGYLRGAANATLTGVVYPRHARLFQLIQGVVYQQHVTGQTCRRVHPLLEVHQHVGGGFRIHVRHEGRTGHVFLELDQGVGTVGLRHGLNVGTLHVLAEGGQVVPDNLGTRFGNREDEVGTEGDIVDTIATVNQLGLASGTLDLVIHALREADAALGLVDRHAEGFRVAFEHRDLARGQVVTVLLVVLGSNGELGLFVGVGVFPETALQLAAGILGQTTGPLGDGPGCVAGLLCADRRQSGTQLIDFGLGQALCCHCAGDQAHRQAAGTNDYVLIHYIFSKTCCLEAYAEADSGEVAVNQGVVLAIKEVGVADAGVVLVGVVGIQTDADRLGVLDEVRAVALNVVRPGDVRAQVDTGNHVAVVQGSTYTIAPGEVGVEAVVFAPAIAVAIVGILRSTSAVSRRALAKQRVAAKLGLTITAADTADVVGTHLTYQGQTACAHHPVNEVHRTHGRLPELFALVTGNVVTYCYIASEPPMGVVMGNAWNSSTGGQQCCPAGITGVDLHRHIRAIAQLTGDRYTTDVGTEADTVQANILGMLEEVTGCTHTTVIAGDHAGSHTLLEAHELIVHWVNCRIEQVSTSNATRRKPRDNLLESLGVTQMRARYVGDIRSTAMIVHGIEAELGVIQLRNKPAKCHAKLAAVTGFLIFSVPCNIMPVRSGSWYIVRSARHDHKPVITASAHYVCGREEGAAVISNGAMPFELIESFHAQVFGQALGEIQHLDRQQTLLQLCARATESGSVDRVDGVDAILDEYTLTPADHLATQTDVTRVLTDEVVVIDEGVKQLDTGPFLERMASRIVDIIEPLTAVLGLEVIPVVATDERAGITVAQFKVMGTLEDLGEEIAFLVVQTTIIRCPGCCLPPLIHPVNHCIHVDEALVRVRHRHAGPDGHLGIELPFDCTDIEVYCVCRATEAGQPDCERQCGQCPSMLCFCHCAAPLGWIQTPGCLGSQTVAISVSWSICPVCLHRTDHLAGPDIQGLNVMDLSPLYSCNCLL